MKERKIGAKYKKGFNFVVGWTQTVNIIERSGIYHNFGKPDGEPEIFENAKWIQCKHKL